MVLQRMRNIEMLALGPRPRSLDIRDARRDEAEMIERLRLGSATGASVKCEVVASRGEIRVFRVRLPYDAHPEDARVEGHRAVHIGDLEREVSQAAMLDHVEGF